MGNRSKIVILKLLDSCLGTRTEHCSGVLPHLLTLLWSQKILYFFFSYIRRTILVFRLNNKMPHWTFQILEVVWHCGRCGICRYLSILQTFSTLILIEWYICLMILLNFPQVNQNLIFELMNKLCKEFHFGKKVALQYFNFFCLASPIQTWFNDIMNLLLH